jgi:hypothetical protein
MMLPREIWPAFAKSLVLELADRPGRIALVVQRPEGAMEKLADALGQPVLLVGRALTQSEAPPEPSQITARLERGLLFDDIEILFAPELALNPVTLIRDLARRGPRIVRWPGPLKENFATFSKPARRDYFAATVSNTVVLHPRPTRFPDEVPFSVRRIP